MSTLVLPRVQAMVLCDEIEESDHEDAIFHLTGVRSAINAAAFPAVHPQLCVFVQMSGHRGSATFYLEIDRVETDDVIFDTQPQMIEFEDPAMVVPDYFRLHNCVFPAAGLYYVQIYSAGKLIGERPLHLIKME
jgi:hypothetical protein